MANIVNPNLPADLPTDWTTSQYVSPNGSEVSLSQQHGYNYLMEQVNAAQTAVNTLAEQAQEAVSGLESGALTATATRSGTTVAITGPEDAVTVTFLAPADWAEGDSYTYNGTPITVTDLNGNPVTDGWKQGAVLTFQISGGVAYFVGGASGSFLPLSGGTMTGPAVGAPGGSTIPQFRNVYYGTEALTPGSSPLPEGTLYITPEMEYEGAGKRTCRFVVGTSTAGWTAADCDYLCDGTADDVEINAAIQALPSTGGEIVILDGEYSIQSPIKVNKSYISIRGSGSAKFNKLFYSTGGELRFFVYVTSDNCKIDNLIADNQTADGDTDYSYGIAMDTNLSKHCKISNCMVMGFKNGIVSTASSSGRHIICNNVVFADRGAGIPTSSDYMSISNNLCLNVKTIGISASKTGSRIFSNAVTVQEGGTDSIGLYLNGASQAVAVGNVVMGSARQSTWFNASNSVLSNNVFYGFNTYGILSNNGTHRSVIANNTVIKGNGSPSDYASGEYPIYFTGGSNGVTFNIIAGNNIMGKNYVDSGTGNTWANNKFE